MKADDNIELSNNDNEDSLNLTIGEEEGFDEENDEEADVKTKGKVKHCLKLVISSVWGLTQSIRIYLLTISNKTEADPNENPKPIEPDSKPEESEKLKEDASTEKLKVER